MTNPQTEFDSPWKDILQQYFEDFMLFFFPQAHGEIDWNRGFEFLDKELKQVVRDAELGRRLVDKLVKIYLTSGEEAWVLLHIEVQSQEESNFAARMFTYNYRIYDCYKRTVASLAILGDERANWLPNQFGYQLFGCRVDFQFPVVKLVDYNQRWSELEASRNPFATVVMAHLKAIETRDNRSERKQWKLALVRRLYEQGFEREDVLNLFQFIDWMMSLPLELEREFWQEFSNFEESRRMRYITSVERIGIQKGIEQTQNQMRQEIEQVRQESQNQMRQVLLESQNQMRQVLLENLELSLELKFGTLGLNLLPEISQIEDVEQLRAILAGLKTAQTVEELRQIYQPTAN
ncbi:Rpn family recombination-promoting nuclease/putative transposase [Iningainema tapete]|uniref:Rpn family recombination-promoting nuclease/putative transposase n=1 Tax=Iningainema tapete BLCC-T55 TaxID=2748662 RepID=A0A8J6XFJ3_9CYAN|nr:Rpn family recombination-promoting nuclease/putative transposase [Iningainema tapete]MBD2771627.1 Rpn family recombination-promoting nuclease/putative transposase [Iningainema tapete BLCC-T55]